MKGIKAFFRQNLGILVALVALCVAAYFLFFRNTDTGTNADEKLSGDYPV